MDADNCLMSEIFYNAELGFHRTNAGSVRISEIAKHTIEGLLKGCFQPIERIADSGNSGFLRKCTFADARAF